MQLAEGGARLAFNITPDSNVGGASHLNYLCAPAVRRRQESKLKIIYGRGVMCKWAALQEKQQLTFIMASSSSPEFNLQPRKLHFRKGAARS